MRKWLAIIIVVIVCVGGLWLISKVRTRSHPVPTTTGIQKEFGVPVTLARLERGDIEDTIEVTGDVTALSSVTLSAKIQGRIAYVAGRAGDPVSKGQVIIRLDPADAQSQVLQAEAALRLARTRVSQARTALAVQKTQASAQIEQAKSQLDTAEAQLQIVRKPTRTQQQAMSENQVISAKANLANAESNLRRVKSLFEQGAISEQMLEQAQTQHDMAKAQYDSAVESLSLVKEGSRVEEIRAAEQQVRQAKENLRMANANAAQVDVRREDVRGAEAGVAQSEANLAFAKQQLAYCTIASPISGFISMRMTEPGETANPGVPLLTVVDLRTVYFEAQVSETLLNKVRPGQSVDVRVDAFSGRTFPGKVARILPTASTSSRNIAVRVHVLNPNGELRPGMFARGLIKIGVDSDVLLAPAESVEERYGDKIVFAVKNGRAVLRKITPGASNESFVQILDPTELAPGDEVVITGHENVSDGTKVAVGQGQEEAVKKLLRDANRANR